MTTSDPATSELKAVLKNQEAQAIARKTIEQLCQAIAVQQTEADRLSSLAEQVTALQTKREDLLADIATGQNKAPQLAKLDANLALQREALAEQGAQAAIEQTVAGLTRKLERTQEELKSLQQRHPALIHSLVRVRAEALGVEYVAAAQQLQSLHDRLVCMCLMQEMGGKWLNGHRRLMVPAFFLDSVQAHAMRHDQTLLEETSCAEHQGRVPIINAEKDALRALGVEIS